MRPTILVGRIFLSVATLFSSATLLFVGRIFSACCASSADRIFPSATLISAGHTFPVGYIFLPPHTPFLSVFLSATLFYNNVHSVHRIFADNTHVQCTCVLHIKRIFPSLPAIFMPHAHILLQAQKKRQQWALKRPQPTSIKAHIKTVAHCRLLPPYSLFCGTSRPDFRYRRANHNAVHVLSNRVQDAAFFHEVRALFIIVQHAAPCAFSIRPCPQVRTRKKAAFSRLFPYIRFLSIRRISLCCPRFGSGHPMPAKHALRGIR